MAIVKRESGSLKSVTNILKQKGIQAECLADLPKILDAQKTNLAEVMKIAEQERIALKDSFNLAVEKLSKEYEQLTTSIRGKFERKLKTIDDKRESVRKDEIEFDAKGFWFKLSHAQTAFALWKTKSQLKSKRKKLLSDMEKELGGQKKQWDEKKRKVNLKNDEYRLDIEKKVKLVQEKVNALEEILKSGTYYGAQAEIKMIELLKKLPETYYVINDVTLELDKSVFFDGDWLSSAQIDHLVVGPAGAFVVEVKNWSKKFTSDGDFFDPYKQVKRHNYVCYTLLRKQFEVKVRNIIAYAGHIPEKPDDSFVKVLSLEQVNGYILWFKNVKHDAETVQRIVHLIEKEIDYAN
jgi:hypothetical protein